jgi:hypothetical protein
MADLKPCPWCGAGDTRIEPNGQVWTGMRYSEPISVSVRHWCPAIPGQPSRMIERIGRDEASAIAAWNARAIDGVTVVDGQTFPPTHADKGSK